MTKYLSRAEAGLMLPKQFAGWMAKPVRRVFIHHTVTGTYDGNEAAGMREIQQIAFTRGFYDISYSFCAFRSGVIGEGRGFGVVGGHTRGYNSSSHAISLVGNYENITPTPEQEEAIRWIVHRGIEEGYISPHPEIIWAPHSAVSSTACPGHNARLRMPAFQQPYEGEEVSQEIIDRINRIETLLAKGNPPALGVHYQEGSISDMERKINHFTSHLYAADTQKYTLHGTSQKMALHWFLVNGLNRVLAILADKDPDTVTIDIPDEELDQLRQDMIAAMVTELTPQAIASALKEAGLAKAIISELGAEIVD